jgi:hypothetical protein
MMWWLAARRAHPYLTSGLGCFAVLILVCRDYLVSLPSITPSGGQVLVMLFVPLPVCVALMMCLESGLRHAEQTGIRPVTRMDNGLILCVALAATAIGAAFAQLLTSPAAHAVGRNAVFLMGLMLIMRPIMGPAAVLAPAGWVIAVTLLGRTSAHTPRPWSVLPYPGDDPVMLAAAWFALAVGMAGTHIPRNRLQLPWQ